MRVRDVLGCENQDVLIIVDLVDASMELEDMDICVIVNVVVGGKLKDGSRFLAPCVLGLRIGFLD
jgi:hypothetical protein